MFDSNALYFRLFLLILLATFCSHPENYDKCVVVVVERVRND